MHWSTKDVKEFLETPIKKRNYECRSSKWKILLRKLD